MVVPVLMTNCHVSEKLKSGPLTIQITITSKASMKAVEVPVASVALREKRSSSWPSPFFFFPDIIASDPTNRLTFQPAFQREGWQQTYRQRHRSRTKYYSSVGSFRRTAFVIVLCQAPGFAPARQ